MLGTHKIILQALLNNGEIPGIKKISTEKGADRNPEMQCFPWSLPQSYEVIHER